jgi:HlyD family secretion protein
MPTVTNNEIRILSNEVQEIISHKPNWIVRNGILLFFLIITILIVSTFFISYPDVVNANAKFTSINAPKEVKTKTEGKLVKLWAAEGMLVQQNDLLGFIESRASYHEVISLSQWVDTIESILKTGSCEYLSKYELISYENLGELQPSFQTFMQGFSLFNQYLADGYFLKRKRMLKADIDYFQQLHNNLLQQRLMQQEDLSLAQQTLDANKTLDADKVISPLDYRNEKSRYLGKALSIPQITAAIIANESSQHEKQKEIAQLENEIAQQKGIFTQSLYTLKAQLEEWKVKYLLIAPVGGRIVFAQFLQENQQLQNNQTICFINPENTQYFAEIFIPQNNFGKIKVGQKVLMKLPAYPYPEFGAIEGRLDFISNIPSDSGYLAKVILPNGLQTNYKKMVQYHEGLVAQGEIITADTKLSDRLFYQLRDLLQKR